MPEHDLVKSYGIPGTVVHLDSKQNLPAKIRWMGSCQPLNTARLGDIPSSWEIAKHTLQVTDPQWISVLCMEVCRILCVDVLQGPGKQTFPPWPIWLEFKLNKRFFNVEDLNPSRWCHHPDISQEVVLCEDWDYKKDSALWTALRKASYAVQHFWSLCLGPKRPTHLKSFRPSQDPHQNIWQKDTIWEKELNKGPPTSSGLALEAQFSSGAQLYLTLCNPMSHNTPGLPVHNLLPEFIQTHVHWVDDAIQPSHPLSSPSPPAFNLFQQQGLFKWVSFSHQVAKVLEFQPQHQSFQWTSRTDLL